MPGILNAVLSACLAAGALAVLVGHARNRMRPYQDIGPAEVNPDLAAGEHLLREVLRGQDGEEGRV